MAETASLSGWGQHGRRCRQGQLGQRAVRTGQSCCGEGRAPTLVVDGLGSPLSAGHEAVLGSVMGED
eukprot:scaffold15134_cov66-Phaeocystis_antarctica.AAC.2